jgi:hypothetical protein
MGGVAPDCWSVADLEGPQWAVAQVRVAPIRIRICPALKHSAETITRSICP